MNASTPASTSLHLDDDAIKQIALTQRSRAMDLVVRKYGTQLQSHARNILKDPQLAADACQEVFIKCMHEARFFDPEFRMRAWLYRVTTNLCLNMVRDRRRRGDLIEQHMRVRSSAPDQVDRVLNGQQQRSLLTAMDSLTQDHRQILLRRYYDDLSYNELSSVLDVKLGTVMSRLSRARTALLEVIDQAPLAESLA